MSFIHYLFLGHFEHDGEVVRFSKSPSDSIYRPVVRSPIEPEVIESVLREVKGVNGIDFPDDWAVWSKGGYLICDKYTRNAEVIDFVDQLVRRTHCDIHDAGAHCDITLREWLEVTHSYAKL